MGIPVFLVILDTVSFTAALGLAYYGARLFLHMRWGKLEKSWKLMTEGAVIFSIGFLSLTIQDLSPAYGTVYIISDYFGTILSTVGIILLFFGIRSHYSVWALKNVQQKRNVYSLRLSDDKQAGISPD
ncbi:MAG: hypothetical protein ACYC7D_12620 [Nitrososphaerales archaeon]